MMSRRYYDEAFSGEKYQRPASELGWLPLWTKVAQMLGDGAEFVDVGCGTGHLFEVMEDLGYTYDATAIDFSEVALTRAKRDGVRTILRDLSKNPRLPSCPVYVFCEVLEHLENDREVMAAVTPGKRIIASFPDFDSTGHVWWAESWQAVEDRYDPLVAWRNYEYIPMRNTSGWYAAEGVRV